MLLSGTARFGFASVCLFGLASHNRAEAATTPFANICTGLGVTLPTLAPVGGVVDNALSGLLGPVSGDLNGVVNGVNTNLQSQLSGKTLSIGVVNPTTGAVASTPSGSCYVSADGFSVDNNVGLSLGGGQIIGLGGTSNATATAGDASAIAFGNGSSTANGVLNAIALGTNATTTVANSVALGAASSAARGAQSGYTAFGASGGQTSVGEVSIGSAGATRQLTNLAPGSASTDAVTVGQLTGTAQTLGSAVVAGLGGGATYNTTTGQVTGPTYVVGGMSYTDIGSALSAANGLAVQYTPNLSGAATNAVDLTKGGTLAPVTIDGLAAGTVSAGSAQAVNGAQLYGATRYFQTNSALASATPLGANSLAIGPLASTAAGATNGAAIGNGASDLVAGGVALGAGSVASRAAQSYVDPFSGATVTTTLGALSVGQVGQERQITNVAAGSALTDAVNVGQLTSAVAPITSLSRLGVQYVADSSGNPTAVVNLAAGNANLPAGTTQTTLTGLAPGVVSSTSKDAVNGAQLNSTILSITTLENQISNNVGNLVYNGVGTAGGTGGPLARGIGSVAAGGGGTMAAGQYSTALGFNAQAMSQSAVAIGQNATVSSGLGAVSIGSGNNAAGNGAVSIGDPNNVSGTGAVGLGADNTVTGQGAVGIGNLNQAIGQSAVALGDSAVANGVSAVAIGQSANAAVDNAVAIGNGASSTGTNSAAIGAGSTDGGQSNVVGIGNAGQTRKLVYLSNGTLASGSTDAVNGGQLYALGSATASALGGGATYNTTTGGLNAPTYTIQGNSFSNVGSALGAIDSSLTTIESGSGIFVSNNAANAGAASASGANSAAGGYGSSATGAASTVVGNSASDNGVGNSTVLGNGAGVASGLTGSNAAIGQGALAATGARAAYTAFGLGGGQVSAGEISFGSSGAAHQLTNVAAGSAATDAVNVAQLQGAASNVGTSVSTALGGGATYNTTTGQITGTTYNIAGNTYTSVGGALTALNSAVTNEPVQYSTSAAPTTANPGVVSNDVTLVGSTAGTPVTLHNVAAGSLAALSTDAVNGSQLNTGNTSIASIFGGGTTFNATTGQFGAPSYSVQGNNYSNVGSAFGAVDNALTTLENGGAGQFVSNNAAGVASASATGANASAGGFGSQASGAASTVVGNSASDNSVAKSTVLGNSASVAAGLTGSNAAIGQGASATTGAQSAYTAFGLTNTQTSAGEVSIGSAGAAHQLTNVAAGSAATDAVNVAQLQGATANLATSITSVLGGGSTYNTTTGQITGTTYNIGGNTYTNVSSALTALNTSVANEPLQYSTTAAPTTANPGVTSNDVTLVGSSAGSAVTVHNVAGGSVASTSTDAVNGSQLNASNTSIATILGGGATYNTTTGAVNTPTYTVNNVSYNTVGGAIGAINTTINGGGASPYFYTNSTQNAALATGSNATAAGANALASGTSSVALGSNAVSQGTNSVAIGAGSTDGGQANVVSVGAVGAERRIVNVAAGTLSASSTDAVNGSQLYQTNMTVASLGHNSLQYDTNGAGGTVSSVTLNSDQGGPVIIHNLAPGVATSDAATVGQVQTASANSVQYTTTNGVRSNTIALAGGQPGGVVISNVGPGILGTDAANVNQVQAAAATATAQSNAYTDQRVNNLAAYTQQQITQARKDAAGGTAVALAAAGLRYDDRPGKVSIGGSSSYYHNQMGVAFGISTTSDNGRVRLNATVAASPTVGHADIGAGVGASLALD